MSPNRQGSRSTNVRQLDQRARAFAESMRERNGATVTAVALYERDKSSYASVLGSAVALRLFLFIVPATVVLASLVGMLRARPLFEKHLESTVSTGDIARALSTVGGWRLASLLVTGLVLTLIAGRSLTKVLSTCAVTSWNLDADRARARPITVVALSGILFVGIAASAVLGSVGDAGGVPIALAVWAAIAMVTTLAWFLVLVTLPRAVNDPGALLPGALVMGVAYAALQAVMHVYLPGEVARTSATFGNLAATVAVLGHFFFVGRIMAASFVVCAVTYERFGSLSQVVFGWPIIHRLPRRYPSLARYFSLDGTSNHVSDTEQAN